MPVIEASVTEQVSQIIASVEIDEQVIEATIETVQPVINAQVNYDGLPGPQGFNAYQIAVQNGFTGTVSEWLASLKGDEGLNAYQVAVENAFAGTVSEWLESLEGEGGAPGLTAYQVAVANGFTGTVNEWLASLQGEDGLDAYEVAVENGFAGTRSQWLASLKGNPGDPGPLVGLQSILDVGAVFNKDNTLRLAGKYFGFDFEFPGYTGAYVGFGNNGTKPFFDAYISNDATGNAGEMYFDETSSYWAIQGPSNWSRLDLSGSLAYFQCGNYAGTNTSKIQLEPGLLTISALVHKWKIGAAGATEAMRLDASGNLGIGQAVPAYKVHIAGHENNTLMVESDHNFGASFVVKATSPVSGQKSWEFAVTGEGSAHGIGNFLVWNRNLPGAAIHILNTNNNVVIGGVGSANPLAKLSVRGNAVIGSNSFSLLAGPTNGLAVEGFLALGTNSGTHSLTLAAASTGIAHYLTADQTINYERARWCWVGNIYSLNMEYGGGGGERNIQIARLKINADGTFGMGAQPVACAALDISHANKGLLIPRLDNAAQASIPFPLSGLLHVNTDVNRPIYYDGVNYQSLAFTTDVLSGGAGGGNTQGYLHTQSAASNTWVIVHGLDDVTPFVEVYSGGVVIQPTGIAINTSNQITLSFASSVTGTAKVVVASSSITSNNLDGGTPYSTYGGIPALDGGTP